VLALATLAIYAQTYRFGFLAYDDDQYVYNTAAVKEGLTPSGLAWAFTTFHCSNWHPVTWLSHMLDCRLFGLNAGAHHVTNVLLHVANTLLLFVAFAKMTRRVWRSFIIAGILAVHPLHVESVVWVSQRKDLLSAFLGLLTLLVYIGYVRRPTKLRLASVAVVFALALAAKPMLVTFPFVLLLLDVWPLGRLSWPPRWRAVRPLIGEKAVFFALTAAASVATFVAQKWSGAVQPLTNLPLGARLANASIGYASYIVRAFWPAGLGVLYPFGTPSAGAAMASLIAILAVTVAVIFLGRKRPYAAVGWFWYLGMLVPVIGIVQVGAQSTADRYTYLPLVGVSLALVWLIADIAEGRTFIRRAAGATGCVALILLGGLAWRQTSYWTSSRALFEHTLAVTQGNFVILNNLGVVLSQEGRFSDAIASFRKALEINPDYADAHANLRTLAVTRRDCVALNDAGVVLVGKGRFADAMTDFQKALEINPDYAEANANLGRELLRAGKVEDACPYLTRAVRAVPGRADVRAALGTVLAAQGKFEESRIHLEEAARIAPDQADTHSNLGFVLARLGRVDEAISRYREALRLKPDHIDAHYNMGMALIAKGKRAEAAAELSKALALDPGHGAARAALEKLQAPQ